MKNNRLKSAKRKRAILQSQPVSMMDFLKTAREIATSHGKKYVFVRCEINNHFGYIDKIKIEFQVYAEGNICTADTPQGCIDLLRKSFGEGESQKGTIPDDVII